MFNIEWPWRSWKPSNNKHSRYGQFRGQGVGAGSQRWQFRSGGDREAQVQSVLRVSRNEASPRSMVRYKIYIKERMLNLNISLVILLIFYDLASSKTARRTAPHWSRHTWSACVNKALTSKKPPSDPFWWGTCGFPDTQFNAEVANVNRRNREKIYKSLNVRTYSIHHIWHTWFCEL